MVWFSMPLGTILIHLSICPYLLTPINYSQGIWLSLRQTKFSAFVKLALGLTDGRWIKIGGRD